jgi:hypothetical protein
MKILIDRAAAGDALKEAATSTRRSVRRTSITLAIISAVIWFAPCMITGTASPCGALAVARVSFGSTAFNGATKTEIAAAQTFGGALVAMQMADKLPNVPPQLTCLVGLWTGSFLP